MLLSRYSTRWIDEPTAGAGSLIGLAGVCLEGPVPIGMPILHPEDPEFSLGDAPAVRSPSDRDVVVTPIVWRRTEVAEVEAYGDFSAVFPWPMPPLNVDLASVLALKGPVIERIR